MDMEEIRYLLGGTVFARAKAYTDRIQDLNCEVAGNGVRHLSADVCGGGALLQAHRRAADVGQRESGPFRQSAAKALGEPGEHPGRGAGHGQPANAPAGGAAPQGQLCLQPGNAVRQEVAGRGTGI